MTRTTESIVDEYYACWRDLAFDRLAGVLHNDVAFHGPMDSAAGAAAFIALVKRNAALFQGVRFSNQRRIVDGGTLVMLYDFCVGQAVVPTAEAFEVRDGRIARIDLYFDPSPFRNPTSGTAAR